MNFLEEVCPALVTAPLSGGERDGVKQQTASGTKLRSSIIVGEPERIEHIAG